MQDPFTGAWKLNPGKSDFDANHRPAAATMTFELDAEGRYLMTAEGSKGNGETVKERPTRMIPDGKPYPVPDFPGLSAVCTRPDSRTLHAEARREDGSTVGGGTYTVSADGASLTAENFGYDTQLRQFKQRTVWDRQ